MKVLTGSVLVIAVVLVLFLFGDFYDAIANRYVYDGDFERIDRWTRKTEQLRCILPGGLSAPLYTRSETGTGVIVTPGCIDHAWREVK